MSTTFCTIGFEPLCDSQDSQERKQRRKHSLCAVAGTIIIIIIIIFFFFFFLSSSSSSSLRLQSEKDAAVEPRLLQLLLGISSDNLCLSHKSESLLDTAARPVSRRISFCTHNEKIFTQHHDASKTTWIYYISDSFAFPCCRRPQSCTY